MSNSRKIIKVAFISSQLRKDWARLSGSQEDWHRRNFEEK
jgi:hypothetical protein